MIDRLSRFKVKQGVLLMYFIINICYSPAGRSVLGKTVPSVSSTVSSCRQRMDGRGAHETVNKIILLDKTLLPLLFQ